MGSAQGSFVQAWQALYLSYGSMNAETTHVAVDASGNVYTATAVHKSLADTDLILRKYTGSGTLIWGTALSGSAAGQDSAAGFAFDTAGNAYFAGTVYKLYSGFVQPHSFVAKFDPNGLVSWSVGYPKRTVIGIAADGDGSSAGRVAICGTDIKANGSKGAFLQILNPANGSSIAYRPLFDSDNAPTSDASNLLIGADGRLAFVAVRNEFSWMKVYSKDGLSIGSYALDAAGVSQPHVTWLKPSGNIGVVYLIDHGLGGTAFVFRTCSPTGWPLRSAQILDVNSGFGPVGLVPMSHDRMVTPGGQTTSNGVNTLLAICNDEYPFVSTSRIYTVDGSADVHDIVADDLDKVYVGESLAGPGLESPVFHIISSVGGREYRDPLRGEVLKLALAPNGDVFAAGYLEEADNRRNAVLKRLIPVPSAVNDRYELESGMPLSVGAPGPFTNDFGVYGAALKIGVPPRHGTAELHQDGTFLYTPNSGFIGIDTMTYIISKPAGASAAVIMLVSHPKLTAFTVSAPTAVGGVSLTGTLSLSQADAVANNVVTLNDDSWCANEPGFVVVPVNQKTVSFMISTAPYVQDEVVTVSATLRGVTKSVTFTVLKPVMTDLILSPPTVQGGGVFGGRVTLGSNVYIPGDSAQLSSDRPDVSVPPDILIAGRTNYGTFAGGMTSPVLITQTCTITANYRGSTKTATLTITP